MNPQGNYFEILLRIFANSQIIDRIFIRLQFSQKNLNSKEIFAKFISYILDRNRNIDNVIPIKLE